MSTNASQHAERGIYPSDAETPSPDKPKGMELVRLSDVEPEEVRWLWPGRIPLGKLTILDGDPGTAKTTLALDLAARISNTAPMSDGSDSDLDGPRGVVILTAEDGLADTIRPRLDAAVADVERIVALPLIHDPDDGERLPTVEDVDAVQAAIDEVDAALVIFDPLAAYLGSKVDAHRDASVRSALAGLARLAEETGVAVLAIRHLNKSQDKKAMYRGGGSIAFTASARSVLLVAPDPDDPSRERHVLASVKCNLAKRPTSLAYEPEDGANGALQIEWLGPSHHRAGDLLSSSGGGQQPKRDRAKEWLRAQLSDGPVPVDELRERADRLDLSWSTVQRAKNEVGVKSKKQGFEDSYWTWRLPDGDEKEIQPPDRGEYPKSPPDQNLATFEQRNTQKPHESATSPKAAKDDNPGHLREHETRSKTANDEGASRLRESPASTGTLSDPEPEDGQNSRGDHLQLPTGDKQADESDDYSSEDSGRRPASVPTSLVDGESS